MGKRARALYACKAEHDSELSFIAGTIFENGESPFNMQTKYVGEGEENAVKRKKPHHFEIVELWH